MICFRGKKTLSPRAYAEARILFFQHAPQKNAIIVATRYLLAPILFFLFHN